MNGWAEYLCSCTLLRTVALQESRVHLPQHPLVSLFPKHASDLIDIISMTIFAKMLYPKIILNTNEFEPFRKSAAHLCLLIPALSAPILKPP